MLLKNLLRCLIIFQVLAFAIPFKGNAQPSELPNKNIVFDHLSASLGLDQVSVNCILQDRDGYLWMGTWSGLIRYDGYQTTVFQADYLKEGQLKSNKITTLFEDDQGYLWVGTHTEGLFKYNKLNNTFQQFKNSATDPSSLSNNNVWCIEQDRDGQLWIGTENGLNQLDSKKGTFKHYFSKNDNQNQRLTYHFVTDILASSNGDIWISTEEGLNKLSIHSGQVKVEQFYYRADPGNSELHNYIYQIDELSLNGQSTIWCVTKMGLKKLSGDVMENFEYPNATPGYSFFRTLKVVNENNTFLLVGSERGLHFFDPFTEKFTRFLGDFDKRVNLSHNSVSSIFIDRAGVLWLGTKKGLNKYDSYSKNFERYLTQDFDKTSSIITGIVELKSGHHWISTIGGGLFKIQKPGNGLGKEHRAIEKYKIATVEKNDFTDFIQTLYTDSKGRIWLGTAGAGVYVFDEKNGLKGNQVTQFKHYDKRSEQKLSDDYIMSITEDSKGAIWVGTWSGGLNKIEDGKAPRFFSDALLTQSPLVCLTSDHTGALWVGTRGNGIYRITEQGERINMKQFVQGEQNGLGNNFINSIYTDHFGALWIGTEGGLYYFDRRSESFKHHPISESGNDKVVVGILEDDKGRLWLSHWDGITLYDPQDSTLNIKNYDIHDRIQGGFFYNNVCLKDTKGHLYFGGANGFNIIDPSSLVQNPSIPKIVIRDLRIFNESILSGKPYNNRIIIDQPLPQMKKVELKHFENSISFEFAALDYAAPEKIRYAYKMEGYDEKWVYTDADRRFANYTNLPNGHYTFKVRATNNDGIWSTDIKEVKLSILPPWWKTIWAIMLYMLTGLGILYLFRRLIIFRTNFINDLKYERLERENVEKLNKAKLQFFTNISHEFRTPLTLIMGPLQNLLDSAEGGKFVREQLTLINKNASRLLRLVNQLMDFRKIDSGSMNLEVAEGNMVKFVKEIKLSFDALAEKNRINFSFWSSSNVLKIWFDRDQFEKILFNLLSNAFKHTPEGGKISIKLMENDDQAILVIEDNGSGIKKEHFDDIFKMFYSYDQSHQHMGTGIGLALTKSLVELHHGKISVESEEQKFTRFTLNIPKGNSHFDPKYLAHDFQDSESIKVYPSLEIDELSTGETPSLLVPKAIEERHSILIVEDNPEVRNYIKSIFRDQYVVLEAEDGEEGYLVAQDESPDLIISDVMMPKMDGINLCKQLKADVRTSHIPVVMLTARTSLIFKLEGLETGADDYLTKPFSPRVLLLKVRNLINTRESMRRLFTDSQTLRIEPKRVTLTSTDEVFIHNALESVENNMSNSEYSVEELGRDVGMSRMQLYRKLKALTGQSANEFIRTLRLKRAAQLFEHGQLNISEVTYEVGFTDLQYFRSCFKKQFGVNPSEYAKRDGII